MNIGDIYTDLLVADVKTTIGDCDGLFPNTRLPECAKTGFMSELCTRKMKGKKH